MKLIQIIGVFIGVAIAFNATGQSVNDEINNEGFNKIQIGINFSTDYNFRVLGNNDGTHVANLIEYQKNQTDIAKVSYSFGLNACYNINKSFGLESGIHYSDKGYKTKKIPIFHNAVPGAITELEYSFNWHYLDIPLKLNYIIGKSNLRFFFSVELTTNIFLNAKNKVTGYSAIHTETDKYSSSAKFNKINFSPSASLGIDYKLNNKINIRIDPTYSYGVLNVIDEPIEEKLYSFGLNFACYYAL